MASSSTTERLSPPPPYVHTPLTVPAPLGELSPLECSLSVQAAHLCREVYNGDNPNPDVQGIYDNGHQFTKCSAASVAYSDKYTRIIVALSQTQQTADAAHMDPVKGAAIICSRLFLCVRGTVSAADIIRDIQVLPKRNANGLYHTGFMERADDIPLSEVRASLLEGNRVIICGHSLGGAVATLLVKRLIDGIQRDSRDDCVDRLHCITFGAPLLCTNDAAAFMSAYHVYLARFIMFIHPKDIVPKLLYSILAIGQAAINSKVAKLLTDVVVSTLTATVTAGAGLFTTATLTVEKVFDTLTRSAVEKLGKSSVVERLANDFLQYAPFGRFFLSGEPIANAKARVVNIDEDGLINLLSCTWDQILHTEGISRHDMAQYQTFVLHQFGALSKSDLRPTPFIHRFRAIDIRGTAMVYCNDRIQFHITGEHMHWIRHVHITSVNLTISNESAEVSHKLEDRERSHNALHFKVPGKLKSKREDSTSVSGDWTFCDVFGGIQTTRVIILIDTTAFAENGYYLDIGSMVSQAYSCCLLNELADDLTLPDNKQDVTRKNDRKKYQNHIANITEIEECLSSIVDSIPLEALYAALANCVHLTDHNSGEMQRFILGLLRNKVPTDDYQLMSRQMMDSIKLILNRLDQVVNLSTSTNTKTVADYQILEDIRQNCVFAVSGEQSFEKKSSNNESSAVGEYTQDLNKASAKLEETKGIDNDKVWFSSLQKSFNGIYSNYNYRVNRGLPWYSGATLNMPVYTGNCQNKCKKGCAACQVPLFSIRERLFNDRTSIFENRRSDPKARRLEAPTVRQDRAIVGIVRSLTFQLQILELLSTMLRLKPSIAASASLVWYIPRALGAIAIIPYVYFDKVAEGLYADAAVAVQDLWRAITTDYTVLQDEYDDVVKQIAVLLGLNTTGVNVTIIEDKVGQRCVELNIGHKQTVQQISEVIQKLTSLGHIRSETRWIFSFYIKLILSVRRLRYCLHNITLVGISGSTESGKSTFVEQQFGATLNAGDRAANRTFVNHLVPIFIPEAILHNNDRAAWVIDFPGSNDSSVAGLLSSYFHKQFASLLSCEVVLARWDSSEETVKLVADPRFGLPTIVCITQIDLKLAKSDRDADVVWQVWEELAQRQNGHRFIKNQPAYYRTAYDLSFPTNIWWNDYQAQYLLSAQTNDDTPCHQMVEALAKQFDLQPKLTHPKWLICADEDVIQILSQDKKKAFKFHKELFTIIRSAADVREWIIYHLKVQNQPVNELTTQVGVN